MIKRILANISLLLSLILSQSIGIAASNSIFNVSATGPTTNVSLTLCLNGKALLSCQNYNVAGLTLAIRTNIPNHIYPAAGIRINTPGYSLGNLGLDCTPNNNGACLFSVNYAQEKTINLVVNGPLSIMPSSLVTASRNTPYTQTITATGGIAPYFYVISEGSLPTGLTLDSATGVLSGTPTIEGIYTFSITATDSNYPNSNSGSQDYSLTVNGALSINPSSLPSATQNMAYEQTVSATGGVTPYSYEITAGTLPSGLSLNNATGEISGTPTTSGSYSFTITVTDANSDTGFNPYTIIVNQAAPVSFTTPGSYSWTVPSGVTSLQIVATGAGGGGSGLSGTIPGQPGGAGATVTSILSVSPNQTLNIVVGGGGGSGTNGPGDSSGYICGSGAGGGGASTVDAGDSDQIIAGGGGGGGACNQGTRGGNGSNANTGAGGNGGSFGQNTGGSGGSNGIGGIGGSAMFGGQGTTGGNGTGGQGGAGGGNGSSYPGGAGGSGVGNGTGGNANNGITGGGGGGYGGGGSGAQSTGGGAGGSVGPAGSVYAPGSNGGASATAGGDGSIVITTQ